MTENELSKLIEDYLKISESGKCYFKVQNSHCDCDIPEGTNPAEVIRYATKSKDKLGKKCSHQYRIKLVSLKELEDQLLWHESYIKECKDFDELYEIVKSCTDKISGCGELVTYDVAVRIGCFAGVKPEAVYIHAGTRKGALNLGLNTRKRLKMEVSEFPKPLQNLEPGQMEDFLCIMKDKLSPME